MGLNLTELTDFLPAFAVTLGKTGAKEAKNVSKKAIQRALPGKVSSSIIERAALYMGIQGPVFFGILLEMVQLIVVRQNAILTLSSQFSAASHYKVSLPPWHSPENAHSYLMSDIRLS